MPNAYADKFTKNDLAVIQSVEHQELIGKEIRQAVFFVNCAVSGSIRKCIFALLLYRRSPVNGDGATEHPVRERESIYWSESG
jgi:hypothetical protein